VRQSVIFALAYGLPPRNTSITRRQYRKARITIEIPGGMGPQASVDSLKKVIEATPAAAGKE